ncbi:efflux RND transporter permease subunit [Leptospira broomii]|nr:efflux RND transporter permease subunit [Leptospira broomii]
MHSRKENFLTSRPITIGMFFFGLIIFGFFSFFRVPVSLFPTSAYPGLTISVEFPGADVDNIEETITIPIEEVISGVGGIEDIYSYSERGKTEINVEFAKDVNLEFKSLEIRERIDIVAGQFPREVHKPFIYRYDPDQRPAMIITLESEKYDFIELRSIADHEVKSFLENVDGVSKIAVSGGKVREVLVSCDMQKLRSFGLDLLDIQRAIEQNNKTNSVASVDKQGMTYNLILEGRYKALRILQKLPVYSSERGKNIFIEDVAKVSFSYREEESGSRVNGKENVSVYVYKSSLGNILEISKEVNKKLKNLNIAGLRFNYIYDQAEMVKKSYFNLIICGLIGLAAFLLLVFFNEKYKYFQVRATLVFQIFINFFIFQLILFILKLDFDIIIFSSFLLGFSIWSIICFFLLENIQSKEGNWRLKDTLPEFTTLAVTILALCLPLYILDQDTGESSMRLGFFIVLYLVLSYVSFIPLRSFFNQIRFKYFQAATSMPISSPSPRGRFRHIPGLSAKLFFTLYALAILAGIYRLAKLDKELFYSIENRRILGYIELPSGTGFEYTNAITKKAEEKILKIPGVEEVTTKIDSGHSFLIITLNESQVSSDDFIQKIKQEIGNMSPAFCYFSRESDAGKFKEIVVDVLGDDNEKLDQIVRSLAEKADKLDGIEEVVLRYKPPRDELHVVLDKNKAARASLSNFEIGSFLKLAIQGGVASKFLEENREIDIRIRFSEEFRNSESSLEKFFIKNTEGKFTPLTELSKQKESKSPIKIFRKNKKRSLSFALRTGNVSHAKIFSELRTLAGSNLPENYHIEMGRSVKKTIETEKRIYSVIIYAFLLIYFILSSYFESFKRSILVLLVLLFPFSVTLFFLSYLFGSFTLPMYLGLLLLVALVSFQIIVRFRIKDAKFSEGQWTSFLPALVLFMPQILFAKEGGQFLREFELTIVAGYLISIFLTPITIRYFEQNFTLKKVKSTLEKSVYSLIKTLKKISSRKT